MGKGYPSFPISLITYYPPLESRAFQEKHDISRPNRITFVRGSDPFHGRKKRRPTNSPYVKRAVAYLSSKYFPKNLNVFCVPCKQQTNRSPVKAHEVYLQTSAYWFPPFAIQVCLPWKMFIYLSSVSWTGAVIKWF